MSRLTSISSLARRFDIILPRMRELSTNPTSFDNRSHYFPDFADDDEDDEESDITFSR